MNGYVTDVMTDSVVMFCNSFSRNATWKFWSHVILLLYKFVFSMLKQIAKEVCILRVSKVEDVSFLL